MNEHDVKDVFDQVLDTARRPGADREAMLTLAHRARRRRTVAWAGSAGATAVVIAGVATLAISNLSQAGTGQAFDPGQAPGQAAVVTAPPTTPAPRTDQQYGEDILAALPSLMPAGFTVPTQDTITTEDGTTIRVRGIQVTPPTTGMDGQPIPTGGVLGSLPHGVTAYVDVYRDNKQAAVTVTVTDSAPPADLCAADIGHQGTADNCQVSTASNGAQVRLAWRDVPDYGRIWYATKFYPTRSVTVQQMPNGMDPNKSGWGDIWNEAALIEVAVSPALAP
jgi:hypothetical protein